MNRKICYLLMVLGTLVAGCEGKLLPVSTTPIQAYISLKGATCNNTVGINGKWQLVKVRDEERYTTPAENNIMVIKDCSVVIYYTPGGRILRTDSFKLFRVLNYCADFQLNYLNKNDSVSCINMKRDTLVLGDCSTFETTRYYYKKI